MERWERSLQVGDAVNLIFFYRDAEHKISVPTKIERIDGRTAWTTETAPLSAFGHVISDSWSLHSFETAGMKVIVERINDGMAD